MSTILSTLNYRFVIPLSLGDCNTGTNKAAYASQNNDHVSQVDYIAHSGFCWWHHEIRKLHTTRSTVYYACYTRIIHCRPCCNLLINSESQFTGVCRTRLLSMWWTTAHAYIRRFKPLYWPTAAS